MSGAGWMTLSKSDLRAKLWTAAAIGFVLGACVVAIVWGLS